MSSRDIKRVNKGNIATKQSLSNRSAFLKCKGRKNRPTETMEQGLHEFYKQIQNDRNEIIWIDDLNGG